MKRYLHTALLVAISISLMSCSSDERPRPDTDTIIARQIVIEQFGPEVWESTLNSNTFFARCPDGSVWMVVIQRPQPNTRWAPESPAKVFAKTMIFGGTVPLPTEKP